MLKLISLPVGLIDLSVSQLRDYKLRSAYSNELYFRLWHGKWSYYCQATVHAEEHREGFILIPRLTSLRMSIGRNLVFDYGQNEIAKNEIPEEALNLIALAFKTPCQTVLDTQIKKEVIDPGKAPAISKKKSKGKTK